MTRRTCPPRRALGRACRPAAVGLALALAAAWGHGAEAQAPEQARYGGLQLVTTPASTPLRSFLNRGVWPGYTNYGKGAYTPQTNSVRSTELYDRLGTRLFRGYPLVSWRETRSDSVGLQASSVQRENYFFNYFNNLMVASDSYRGWDFAVTTGDAIRTSLSPLTVRSPRWQGLRVDGASDRQGFTALLTRGATQRFSAFDARRDLSPVLAYGGHYRYRASPILDLGLTAFNQHQTDVESSQGSFVSGSQPYQMRSPKRIWVRVESDEPGTVAGVADVDVELVVVGTDGTRQRRTSDAAGGARATYDPALEPGPPVGAPAPVDGIYRLTDGEAATFAFDLPAGASVVGARFSAQVAGDYRISVRQVHDFAMPDGAVVERAWPSTYVNAPGHNQTGNPQYPFDFKPLEATPHTTVRRAEGQPRMGGLHRVAFDYGIPSGRTLLGTDFRLAAEELMAEGEIAYGAEESHFPFSDDSLGVRGQRLSAGHWAYTLNLRRPLRWSGVDLEVGGELFAMDPAYGGGYDSRRGGTVFFTDKGGGSATEAFTQEFPLMSDNDDNDEYDDDTFNDQGRFQFYVPSGNYSGGPTGGVYPGLDADGDLSPDNDKDRNGVPDWSEPFLLFDSDPIDFAYGIDFNNNGQPDYRENDDHPDYPVRRDQRGRHAFVSLVDALPGVERTSVGYYAMEEIAGSGRSTSVYGRAEAAWRPGSGLEVAVYDDVKRVEDDVRDDVYQWATGDTSRLANVYTVVNPPPPDPLAMRNSLVNTAFVRFEYAPLPSLRLRSDLLHFINRQGDLEESGVLLQEAQTFADLAWIARGQYEHSWGKLRLWGGAKYALREGRRGGALPESSTRFFAPIVKASYEIMDGIGLQWGMSGLPGLPTTYTDHETPGIGYEERKTVLMLQGRTDDFEGANLSISTGVELHQKDWKGFGRERDFDAFALFVEIIVGS